MQGSLCLLGDEAANDGEREAAHETAESLSKSAAENTLSESV